MESASPASSKEYNISSPFSVADVASRGRAATRSKDGQQSIELNMVDAEAVQQPQATHGSEAAVTSGGAEENESLRAEIRRLQSDAKAEQLALDDMMAELISAHDELHDVHARLAAKEAELADERAARVQLTSQALQSTREPDQVAAQAPDISQHHRELDELQQLVDFFKSNSERLGKEIRGLKDHNRQLGEDLDVKQRELEDERSMNLTLKMQAELA